MLLKGDNLLNRTKMIKTCKNTLVLKLNKQAKKSFLKKNKEQKILQVKRNSLGNYGKLFSHKKVLVMNRNLLLKLKKGLISSETILPILSTIIS